MGREKSDGRIVPKGRRKAVPTAETRGGKATTVSKQAAQLDLFSSVADSPRGANAEADPGQPGPAPSAAPKEEIATSQTLPAMTKNRHRPERDSEVETPALDTKET